MKKNNIILLILILTLVSLSRSQWQPDVRLTNSAGRSSTIGGKSIVAENNYLHICWLDDRNGTYEVYYKNSTNAGLTWSSDRRLTNGGFEILSAKIASEGTNIYIVYDDNSTGHWEVYCIRSTNKGSNWSSAVRVSPNDINLSAFSDVSVDGNIYVAWEDERSGNYDIFFSRSTNGGSSWSTPYNLTTVLSKQERPVIYAAGSYIHVVYQDERNGWSNTEIYYRRSTNSGLNWQTEINISNHTGYSYSGYVISEGSTVHIVWEDDWTGNPEIHYRRSTNFGANWSGDAVLTVNSGDSRFPAINASGIYTHLVWSDNRDGNSEIYYSISTNNGSSWGSDVRLTNSTGSSVSASICFSGNVVNVLWSDERHGNREVFYKRNPTGNPTGIININSEIPGKFSLSQNYPNPFNPVTNFEFRIADFGLVNITIYDALGRVVETLVNSELKPGTYKAEWPAAGGSSKFTSGVYFYKLTAGNFTETKKMILLK